MKQIQITVSAGAGGGKTAVSEFLRRALAGANFADVVVLDDDDDRLSRRDIPDADLLERMMRISAGAQVTIKTQHLRRDGLVPTPTEQSGCTKCGSTGIHACTGAPVNWDNDSERRFKQVIGDIFGFSGPVTPDAWVVQDSRQYVGNCVLWWAKDGRGYTTDVESAHRYTREQAMTICQSRETDVAWPLAYVQRYACPTVDAQKINIARALETVK